jgi:CheY-like chemotaxis protein
MAQRPPHQPLLGISVLVVEDDEDARYVMDSYLTHFGAHIFTAADGAEALRHLQNIRPHVIVTDISMPGMDGLQLFQEVRKLPGQAEGPTPIIALTAFSHLRDAARQAGFEAYFVKPIDPHELVREIARLTRE